ncbi:MAG: hypothetical protein M1838_003004 [Thelocarpon superellum]|nr:MAG: hypothetical protein M1838_003004 [Thelocarpon superellum]
MVAIAGFFSPLSANIYFPALPALAQAVHVSNADINLTLTTYLIFQGLSPTIFGDLGDMVGRRPTYILGFIVYIGANIGLALQTSYPALLILRCLQSSGSSGTVALGSGVVADISVSSERGTYLGWATVGFMVGPTLGPVIGGILTQFLGWRSIFWFLVIAAGAFLALFLVTFPETGRNVVGNGSVPPPRWNMSLLSYLSLRSSDLASHEAGRQAQAELAKTRERRMPNPLKALRIIIEKDVAIVLFYNALIYTEFYTILSTTPNEFLEIYGFNNLQIGLCYLPFGIGSVIGSVVFGRVMDWNYRRIALRLNFPIDRKRGDDLSNFPIERARIQVVWPLVGLTSATTLCYGWALERNAPLAAPLILQFIFGFGGMGIFNACSVLLVDLYPSQPATATAANNLCRCSMGAAGTAVIAQMITTMGRGWCFTFVAAVCLLFSPILLLSTRWGPKWREERRVRLKERAER